MKVFLRHKDLHAYGKICESVHKTASANTICKAQEKLCKGVNRVLSARKKYLQHFAVTRKCNSVVVSNEVQLLRYCT